MVNPLWFVEHYGASSLVQTSPRRQVLQSQRERLLQRSLQHLGKDAVIHIAAGSHDGHLLPFQHVLLFQRRRQRRGYAQTIEERASAKVAMCENA